MEPSARDRKRAQRRGSAAVAAIATLIEVILIAAFGNQWYVEHVSEKSSSNGANAILKDVPSAFRWRISNWSGDDGLRLGEVVGCGVVVVLTFLLVWTVVRSNRRPRGFFGPFFAIWAVVLFCAVIAAMVSTFLRYDALYGSDPNPLGTTRFWWSVLQGPSAQVLMWGLVVGLIAAFCAALMTAGQDLPGFENEDEDDAAAGTDAGAAAREPAFFPQPPAVVPAPVVDQPTSQYPDLSDYGWGPGERRDPGADAATEQLPALRHRLYAEPRPPAADQGEPDRPDPTQEIPLRDPTESFPAVRDQAAAGEPPAADPNRPGDEPPTAEQPAVPADHATGPEAPPESAAPPAGAAPATEPDGSAGAEGPGYPPAQR